MLECALLTLNIIEYASIYLIVPVYMPPKQIAQYARILNVSDSVHSIRSLHKLLTVIETKKFSEHCQTFKMEHFTKRTMPECRCATWNFSWQGRDFVELRDFDKCFVWQKYNKTERYTERFWSFFSKILLKIHFEWKS